MDLNESAASIAGLTARLVEPQLLSRTCVAEKTAGSAPVEGLLLRLLLLNRCPLYLNTRRGCENICGDRLRRLLLLLLLQL